MKRETKRTIFDVCVMFYQLIMGGTLFWILVYLTYKPNITGKVISSLGNVSTSMGLPLHFFVILIFLVVGLACLLIQRRIHLKLKEKGRHPINECKEVKKT